MHDAKQNNAKTTKKYVMIIIFYLGCNVSEILKSVQTQ